MKNSELKGSANFLLFCFVFFVSICLFFEQPTIASETIEFKLAWDANTEADLDGYEIYFRDVVSGSLYQKIGDVFVEELMDPDNPMVTITNLFKGGYPVTPSISINELSNNSKYYFAITAFDTQRNISDFSEEVCAEITGSTATECRVDEIIGCGGARGSGIWYWDAAESEWAQMTSETTTGDIAAGDFTGDGKADVAFVWSDGLWYQDGATLAWTKIDSSPPYNVTAGDVTGN